MSCPWACAPLETEDYTNKLKNTLNGLSDLTSFFAKMCVDNYELISGRLKIAVLNVDFQIFLSNHSP